MRLLILLPIVLVTTLFFANKVGASRASSNLKIDIFERIAYHANQNGLDVALVKAIAKVESNFNSRAKNPSDPSYGLMQVTPILAQDFGYVDNYLAVTDSEIQSIMDINNNLTISCKYLKKLSQYSFAQMIQSYNVGEWGYKEGRRNVEYLEKVRGYYVRYSA